MKERYLDIMSRVVDVYTPERFDAYIEKVRANGITEHGLPRLCANIGILMAHGRNLELKHRFNEMMEICCGTFHNGKWEYCSDEGGAYRLEHHTSNKSTSTAVLTGILPCGQTVSQTTEVTDKGITITVNGNGPVGLLLPAFYTDGMTETEICLSDSSLSIHYKGWCCRYESDSSISDLEMICANRNGKYKVYRTEGTDQLRVHISIKPKS